MSTLKRKNANGVWEYIQVTGQDISELTSQLTENTQQMKDVWVSVKDYGAKGDGIADDTKAFNDAIAYIKGIGGGTLFIPKTTSYYWMKDEVVLCNNLRITSNFAILKKRDYTSSNMFVSRSYTGTGYGSGAKNVIIEGIEMQGDFSKDFRCGNTFHHAQNITVRNCVFNECMVNTHSFDLGGCRDITIENCTWYGSKPISGREYVEAVQLDHSSYLSQPSVSNTDIYDGIPTMNVTVQNCRFLPLVKNGTTYPAPNPMGNHSRWKDIFYKNIKFLNNYVEDGGNTFAWSPTHTKGWLHFYHVQDIIIDGNTFVSTNAVPSTIISFLDYSDAHTIDQITMTGSPPSVNYDPQPCKNIKIRNNTFKGFSNSGNDVGLIKVEGYASPLDSSYKYAENVIIDGNTFIDCYNPTNITSTQGISDDVIYLTKVKDARVSNNYLNQFRRMVYGIDCIGLDIISNHGENGYWHPVNIATSSDIRVTKNTFRHVSGAFYIQTSTGVNVIDNKVSDDFGTSFSANLIAIRDCDRFRVSGNELIGNPSSTFTSISVYVGSTDGILRDNMVVNFIPTSITSDSVNVKNQDKQSLTWVSVGDSITYGGSTYGYYQDTALLQIPHVKTHYNRGYSGYSMTKYTNGATGSSIQDVTFSFEVADIYTIFLGTNDFSRNAPIGSTADTSGKLDSFWGGMKKIYADLLTKNPKATIIFITPTKRTSSPAWNATNTASLKLGDYVQAIKDFCSENACAVIDLFNVSGINTTTTSTYLYDGLHPNVEGNKRIGKIIADGINLYI